MRRSHVGRTVRPAWLLLIASGFGLALFPSGEVRAHFLWLTIEREAGTAKPVVHSFLSETPVPAGAEFLKHIEKVKITAGDHALKYSKQEETFDVRLGEPRPNVIDGFCDLGVMKRGGQSFRLLYTARAQFVPSRGSEPEAGDLLRVRLVERPGRPPVVVVCFRGRPLPGAVVKAYPEDGDPVELKTDPAGQVDHPGVAEGRTGLLIKWIEKSPGTVDGKSYDEIRYYATLTVAPSEKTSGAATNTAAFALLPEAINSFGGAVLGDWLYVYSGHTGAVHKYHVGTTSKHFRRLNLRDRRSWEELPIGRSLQGVALVAHHDRLYRIGGMSAHQKPGEPDDLVSVADFARFDPATKTWTDLPALPAPRSTHDAVVVGDKLYVVGGWSMLGGGSANAEFCEDALVYDLSSEGARWETLPVPPFQRRALAAGSIKGKIYVLGGLEEDGNVVKAVAVYDPATKGWTTGPELPGSKLQGFAASAFGVQDKLYVSGFDGSLHRLSEAGDRWEVAGKLAVPRITHRLLPGIGGDLLAVGGTFAGSPVRFVESISIAGQASQGPKVVSWPVALETAARQGQAIGLIQSSLIVSGGNSSSEPHAFAVSNLVATGPSSLWAVWKPFHFPLSPSRDNLRRSSSQGPVARPGPTCWGASAPTVMDPGPWATPSGSSRNRSNGPSYPASFPTRGGCSGRRSTKARSGSSGATSGTAARVTRARCRPRFSAGTSRQGSRPSWPPASNFPGRAGPLPGPCWARSTTSRAGSDRT